MAPRRLSDLPQVHRILARGVHVILECPRCDNQMMVLKTDGANGPWRCQCLEQLGGIIMVPMEIPTVEVPTERAFPPDCIGVEVSILTTLLDVAEKVENAAPHPTPAVRAFIARTRAFIAADENGRRAIEQRTDNEAFEDKVARAAHVLIGLPVVTPLSISQAVNIARDVLRAAESEG